MKKHIINIILIDILLLVTAIVFSHRHPEETIIDARQVIVALPEQQPYVTLPDSADGAITISNEDPYTDTLTLIGPADMKVAPGKYVLHFEYSCTSPGTIVEIGINDKLNSDNSVGKYEAPVTLDPSDEAVDIPIKVSDVGNFEIRVTYNGGDVTLSSMKLRTIYGNRNLFLLLFIIYAFEIAIFAVARAGKTYGKSTDFTTGVLNCNSNHRHGVESSVRTNCNISVNSIDQMTDTSTGKLYVCLFLILVAIGFAATGPLLLGYGFSGDLKFHIDRILGIADWIRNATLFEPVERISSISNEGKGYPWGVFYPQLFLYLPALAIRLGCSIKFSYEVFILFVNCATAIIAYYSFSRMAGANIRIGIFASILYTFSIYRMVNLYSRGALGEILAMTFLPLLFYALTEAVYRDKRKWPLLAVAMSCIIQSHILTTTMCCVFGMLFILPGLPKLFRERSRLLAMFKAIVITFLINLWTIVPLVKCMSLPIKALNESDKMNISMFTVGVRDLLRTYVTGADGSDQLFISVGLVIAGFAAVYAVYAVVVLVRNTKNRKYTNGSRLGLWCLICGAVALFLCTKYCPWDYLETLSFVPNIQFAWRNMSFALVLLSFPAALGMNALVEAMDGSNQCDGGTNRQLSAKACRKSLVIFIALTALCLSSGISYLVMICSTTTPSTSNDVAFMNEADTMYSFSGLEDCDKSSITCSDNCTMTVSGLSLRDGNVRLKATVTTTNIKSGSTVQLPVYYFPGYHLVDSGGNEIEISMASDGRIAYVPTEGMTTITLYYTEAKLWYLADAISLATVVFVLLALLHNLIIQKKIRRTASRQKAGNIGES